MQQLTIYSSSPATTQLGLLALSLVRPGLQIILRPLSERPAPQLHRLASLRQEREELQRELAIIRFCLEQYALGYWLPDACRENGLQADKDALESRLRAVKCTLEAQRRVPASAG